MVECFPVLISCNILLWEALWNLTVVEVKCSTCTSTIFPNKCAMRNAYEIDCSIWIFLPVYLRHLNLYYWNKSLSFFLFLWENENRGMPLAAR